MFKKIAISLCLLSGLAMLAGCATIVDGTQQKVNVRTSPVGGARCYLENDKGRWYIPTTPATAVINRSYNDLHINCSKPGYRHGFTTVASKTKAMAFGNLIVGGAIGAGVDILDGAAYDYPDNVHVDMHKA